MGEAEAIAAALKLIADATAMLADIQRRKNSPEYVAAVEAQDEVNAQAREIVAVHDGDLQAIRSNLAL